MKTYIHSYERDLVRRLAWLESTPEISKENKELMLKFYTYNKLNGLSVPRLIKHCDTLKLTCMQVKKNFSEVTKQDYEAFILYLMEKDMTSSPH